MFALKFPPALPRPSRADGSALPAALAALLVLAFAAQLLLHAPETLPDAAPVAALRLPPLVIAPLRVDPLLASRPLFAPTRRMAGDAASADSPMGDIRVVGAVSLRGRVRVFVQSADGSVRALGIGGQVDDWRLIALTPQGARFTRADETVTLAIGASPPRPAAPAATADSQEEEPQ